MPDPLLTAILMGGAGGLTALGGATVNKLWNLGTGQARIEQKLDDHIADETLKFAGFTRTLGEMDKKLPNGQLEKILRRLVSMEDAVLGKSHAKISRRRVR